MKRILLTAALLLASCIGNKIDPLLFPGASMTWANVDTYVDRGLADGIDDGDLDPSLSVVLGDASEKLGTALRQRDDDLLAEVDWSDLAPWAERGIQDMVDDGEISLGAAESLREEVRNFEETVAEIAR